MAGEKPVQPKVVEVEPAADLALPAKSPLSFWQRVKFLFKVVEIRLRFALILLATFVLIGKWDTIKNYWDKFTRPTGEVVSQSSDIEYFCPMHPTVVRDSLEPDGSIPKCPICSMPLSKRKKGTRGVNAELPAGVTARVQLSPERIQMAGIATVAATYRPLTKELRTVGFVAYDQSRQSLLVTRVSGYLTKLYINKSFQQVAAGEPLAVIYSPDLYSTEQDLILALNRGDADLVAAGKDRLKLLGVDQNEIDEIVATQELILAVNRDQKSAGQNTRIENARKRLEHLGRTAAEIDRIVESRKAESGLVIRSPIGGHVISKNVEVGSHVDAGATLFEVADLSKVWVEAEVYESDMSFLHIGQAAEVAIDGLPNQTLHGRVILVHPHVEAATRTNRVRIELPNPGHVLSPGMYATVKISTPFQDIEPFKSELAAARKGPKGTDDAALIAYQKTCPVSGNKLGAMGTPVKRQAGGKAVFLCCSACIQQFDDAQDHYLAQLSPPPENGVLTVPERAVVDTGARKVVYLEREPGVFDGVEVQLGPLTGDSYPVLKGLAQGDRIAAAGAFLIDAETRLNPQASGAAEGDSTSLVHQDQPKAGEAVDSRNSDTTGPLHSAVELPAKRPLPKPDADALKNLDALSPKDRADALAQQVCPFTHAALGSMGVPVKVQIAAGTTVYLCCDNCRETAEKDPQLLLRKLAEIRQAVEEEAAKK